MGPRVAGLRGAPSRSGRVLPESPPSEEDMRMASALAGLSGRRPLHRAEGGEGRSRAGECPAVPAVGREARAPLFCRRLSGNIQRDPPENAEQNFGGCYGTAERQTALYALLWQLEENDPLRAKVSMNCGMSATNCRARRGHPVRELIVNYRIRKGTRSLKLPKDLGRRIPLDGIYAANGQKIKRGLLEEGSGSC